MTTADDSQRFNAALLITIGVIALLWLIKIYESLTGISLHQFGIFPGDTAHLRGIVLAPLIHGSWSHLMSNSAALLVLLSSAIYGYPRASRYACASIYLLSGVGVWLFARETFHYGASGLTFGLMFFTFVVGALRWDARASALSMLVFFLYGGMIWGIFPGRPGISYEYHFFGAAIGVLCALMFRNLDPPPPRKRYAWEGQDAADDELDDDGKPYWMSESVQTSEQRETSADETK